MDSQVYIPIQLDAFAGRVKNYKERGWRFVNLCGSTVGDKVELLCSFAEENKLENLSLLVAKDEPVPAVSPVYPSAFFFENETKDLFGVQFADMTLDFGGTFYPTSVPTPMNPHSLEAEAFAAVGQTSDDSGEDGADREKASAEQELDSENSEAASTSTEGEEAPRG